METLQTMHEVDLQRHAGDEAPRGEVPLPQLGAAIELDPKVVAALPVADVKEVRARTYARSLWGQTAKIEVRAADGVWSEYFLKTVTGLPNARAMIRGEFASLREMARVSPTFVPAAYAWGSFRTPPAGGPLQTAPSSSLSHSSSDTATATTTPQPAQPRPPFAIVPGPLTYFILLEFRPVARQPPADAAVFARSLAKFHKRSIEVHRSRAARPEPSCAGGGGAKGKARGGRREVGRGPRLLEMEHQQQRRRPDELRRSDDDDDEMTDGDDEDEDDDALRDHDYGRRQRRRQGGRGHGRGQGLFGFDTATCHGRTSQRVGRWTASWAELFGGLLGAMFERDEVDRRARRRAAAAAITGEGEGKERVVVVPRAVREADAEADEEWDALWRTVVADVVPALLGPLQQSQGEGQGQGIEPCLVHGDLWDENTAEEAGTGEAFVFDPASFWAHNEYELGNWRASRHRLSASGAVQAYKDEFPPSKPEHQWDDRNRLYSLRFDIGTVIGIPGCGLRAVIKQNMTYLCVEYCFDKYQQRIASRIACGPRGN